MATATFRIWRGEKGVGKFQDYTSEVAPGMVVLDSVHHIQAEQANDLAVRWNCKAGKCGSCSAEINGMPKLMCMTRLNSLPLEQPVTIEPMKAFPHVKDLVTELSWNYGVKKAHREIQAAPSGRSGRDVARGASRCRSRPGVSQMHRMLPLPGRVPRASRTPHARPIHRAAFLGLRGGAGNASTRRCGSHSRAQNAGRHRAVQHYKMLHESVSGEHYHHRQCHHSLEGARGGSLL